MSACSTQHADEIAAVIVEPVPANMGVVPPEPGFLQFLREITRAHGALLIFDEVITGFRLAFGGAQIVLRRRAGPDVPGQDHRRRAAGGRVRRAARRSWR